MSSRYSSVIDEVTQSWPNVTRAERSRMWWPGRRVSTACSNRAIRVSAHRRLPNRIGELTAHASTGPASSWATLYRLTNSSGVTCRCTWKLALHASAITESWRTRSSSMPLMCSS